MMDLEMHASLNKKIYKFAIYTFMNKFILTPSPQENIFALLVITDLMRKKEATVAKVYEEEIQYENVGNSFICARNHNNDPIWIRTLENHVFCQRL